MNKSAKRFDRFINNCVGLDWSPSNIFVPIISSTASNDVVKNRIFRGFGWLALPMRPRHFKGNSVAIFPGEFEPRVLALISKNTHVLPPVTDWLYWSKLPTYLFAFMPILVPSCKPSLRRFPVLRAEVVPPIRSMIEIKTCIFYLLLSWPLACGWCWGWIVKFNLLSKYRCQPKWLQSKQASCCDCANELGLLLASHRLKIDTLF